MPEPAKDRPPPALVIGPTVKVAAALPSVMVRVPPVKVTAPVPRLRLLFAAPLAAKVKSPATVTGLLLVSVFAEPLVLSIVPPLIKKVLATTPSAVVLLIFNWVPAASVT